MTRTRRLVRAVRTWGGRGFLILLVLPALVLRVADELSWAPAAPELEPGAAPLAAAPPSVRLHLHLHTEASHDAVGTPGEVARAASRSGVDAVWVSDHLPRGSIDHAPEAGAGPAAPRWIDGVLFVEGREFTVAPGVGRVLLFGVDTTFTEWSGGVGALRDLLSRSPWAFATVTHGRGGRERDLWHGPVPEEIHGWEALTLSDAARRRVEEVQAVWRLPMAVVSLLVGRFHHTLAGALREGPRDPGLLAFDSLAAGRQLALLGSGNPHPKVRVLGVLVPPYGASFRALSTHVALDEALPSDPLLARDAVHRGLRGARSWISILDGEGARTFQFLLTGVGSGGRVGDAVAWEPGLTLRAAVAERSGVRTIFRVIRDGVPILEGEGTELEVEVESPGLYRVEVERFRSRVGRLHLGRRLWIVSSPIRVLDGEVAAEDGTAASAMEKPVQFR